jgi:hypothetical protein
MKSIIKTAREGDHLLFYFAGHGTQTPPNPSIKHSDTQTGDLALVLFDQKAGARHLRSKELSELLKGFTSKNGFVTAVLDCCYSASVVRHGDIGIRRIRGAKFDPISTLCIHWTVRCYLEPTETSEMYTNGS